MKILIVDDSRSDQHLYQYALRASGFQLDVALTGGAGLESVAQALPDLILLDYDLPDLSGLDVLERLHAMGIDVPVIMFTGSDDVTLASNALKAGALCFFTKDISGRYLRELPKLISRVAAVKQT